MILVEPVIIPRSPGVAIRELSVQLTRDGESTLTTKTVLVLHPQTLVLLACYVVPGSALVAQRFVASAMDGARVLLAKDEQLPKRAAARYPQISEDTIFSIDLNDGSGSGGGVAAELAATVKVDGLPADRQVVAVEQLPSGEWRVAGYDSTAGGEVVMDLRVAGSGQIYVMALDNWGTQYQPSLNVGVNALVRPSIFMGWLYRVTQAGQLPAVEPAWWDDSIQGPQPLGTARAEVVRYYAPQGRGPIPVEVS